MRDSLILVGEVNEVVLLYMLKFYFQ